MKATGIVRRIDDLGRVVIPKEIRRTMKIKEGDPLEIFIDREGEIILKKYSPIGELTDFASEYVEALHETTRYAAIITDIDSFIALSSANKKEFPERRISPDLEKVIDSREIYNSAETGKTIRLTVDDSDTSIYTAQVIAPITLQGDAIGAVMLVSKDKNAKMGETEVKLVKSASIFLSRQMEN